MELTASAARSYAASRDEFIRQRRVSAAHGAPCLHGGDDTRRSCCPSATSKRSGRRRGGNVLKSRTETWAATDRPGRRAAHRGDWRALGVHERHVDAAAPEPAGRAVRDAFGPVATVDRRGGAGAADRPCAISPSRTCRDFRWPSVSAARSCGPKALAGRISRTGCRSRQIRASGSAPPPWRSRRPQSACCWRRTG